MELLIFTAFTLPGAAGVQRLASLSRLTHLDLGRAEGIAALAPRLPNLRSLSLRLDILSASAAASANISLLSVHMHKLRSTISSPTHCSKAPVMHASVLARLCSASIDCGCTTRIPCSRHSRGTCAMLHRTDVRLKRQLPDQPQDVQELAPLNALTRLERLSLAASVCDKRLNRLQLGASVEVLPKLKIVCTYTKLHRFRAQSAIWADFLERGVP